VHGANRIQLRPKPMSIADGCRGRRERTRQTRQRDEAAEEASSPDELRDVHSVVFKYDLQRYSVSVLDSVCGTAYS